MSIKDDNDDQYVNESIETEITLPDSDDVEIEVVDDTPPEDRNRKPLGKDALAEDDSEAEQYTEKVKRRMGELRHQAHDERRAKEAALRERDEAVRVAKETYKRAKELEQRLTQGEASYATEIASKADLALEAAKQKHKQAYENGDSERMAEAVAEMAEAKAQAMNAKRWAEDADFRAKNPVQDEENLVDSDQHSRQQQRTAPPKPDPAAVEWAERNQSWFQKDFAMTSLAMGVHNHLVQNEGLDPVKDAAKYYAFIDREMRKRFPDHSWEDSENDAPRRKKTSQPVAPVSRVASGQKNKVVLNKTQVEMAKKFGLTLEQYARELQKLNQG